jgi:hypothetical protein
MNEDRDRGQQKNGEPQNSERGNAQSVNQAPARGENGGGKKLDPRGK